MPDTSTLQSTAFNCEGGLVLDKSTFMMQPGEALELTNFEPDIKGGYRRINGFRKYVNHQVPQTNNTSEKVLLSCIFADRVVAARGERIYSAGTTELSLKILSTTGMTGSGTVTVDSTSGFSTSGTLQISDEIFTYTGVSTFAFTGVTRATSSTTAANHSTDDTVSESWTQRDTGRTNAGKYNFERFNFDGNDKLVLVDGTNAPVVFNSSMSATYAGKSTTPQEVVFSEPLDEDDFDASDGAGSIKVDDTIVGLKAFRDSLFIFCENRIFKLTGSSLTDFAVQPVTRNIGCINGDTIQEFAGDLMFIPDKTQYRLFFTKATNGQKRTRGVVCVMKESGFEFSETLGIKPSCTDSFITAGDVIVIHGDFEGYVHRQEKGNTFDGITVLGRYRGPDISFGDAGLRKHMHRVILNYEPEAAISADLVLRYDNENVGAARPAPYTLTTGKVGSQYGTAVYSTASSETQFVYGGGTVPLVRQPVEGSGFTVALRVDDNGVSSPYSLKGFQLEYQVGARR